jgi:hypothetical protein
MAKTKTFVDELIEVNKRIPRRLRVTRMGGIVTSQDRVIVPKFLAVRELDFFEFAGPMKIPLQNPDKPYDFQLGQGDYCGSRNISTGEANLALGRDFDTASEGYDIAAMLGACEQYSWTNAYVLGPNVIQEGVVRVPVAYFRIPERLHRALAIDCKDKCFSQLVKRLREEEGAGVEDIMSDPFGRPNG